METETKTEATIHELAGTEGAVGLAHWTVGHDAAYKMPWKTLMKKMTETYCPRSEIKKLEMELWNLKEKGTDVMSYIQRFQELVLLCARILPEESDKAKMLQEAIELANDLMDQKVRAYVDRKADNKRRMDNNSRDKNAQQPPYKRQNVARAYYAGPSEKKKYVGTLPLCNKCKFYHNGPSIVTCANCTDSANNTRKRSKQDKHGHDD
ncbi:reverse transcriptase domain-containing protein [Tanacetum coccineum]